MALFVIERNFADQLDPDELDYAGIRLVNDDVGVRWVYSFLSADKKKTYCLYEAPNPEAITRGSSTPRHPCGRDRRRRKFGPKRPTASRRQNVTLPNGAHLERARPNRTHHTWRHQMTTITTATDLLTDDMLARFDERAADLRPREPVLRRGLRGAARARATCSRRARPSSAAPASASTSYSQLQRRLAYVAPATALAVNMHCYWTGVAADLLQGRRRRRAAGCSRRPPTARSSPRSTARPATTSRCCCRRRNGRAGRRRLGDHRPQDLRQPLAGVDLRRLPRHGHVRPGQPADRPRLPAARRPTGFQIVETWDTLGMRATQSQDTILDKAFVPDELRRAGVPGRVRRRRPVPGRHLRLGAAWASPPSTSAPPSGRSTSRSRRMPKRTSIALTRLDGAPPRGAAQRRRDAHRATTPPRRCSSAPSRRLGHRRRARRLAGAPRRHPATSSSTRPSTSSTGRSTCRGGAGVFKRNRLEQIFRDVRMGRFHPGNTLLAHELIGKLCLGINPDDPQRWG